MDIQVFMKKFAAQLEEKVSRILTPLYQLREDEDDFESQAKPYSVQREAVRALTAAYKAGIKSPFIVGEMGCGKTLISTWLVRNMKAKRVLVICPPHLVSQWQDEIGKVYPDLRVAIIPNERLKNKGLCDLAALQEIHRKEETGFVIISREAIKTRLPIEAALYKRPGLFGPTLHCPHCFLKLKTEEEDGVPIDVKKEILRSRGKCEGCGSPLYKEARGRLAINRPSMARYIKRKMRGFFSHLIFDEVHEYKAEDTAQGAVHGMLARFAPSLNMTGTLSGGKASDIFYLLFRTCPADMIREGFQYNSVQQFVERFGAFEEVQRLYEDPKTGRKRFRTEKRERPGLSPLAVGTFLINKTIFLRLSDFAEALPVFMEQPIACKLHPKLEPGYRALQRSKEVFRSAKDPMKVLSSTVHAMLAYPDSCMEETVFDRDKDGSLIRHVVAPEVDIPLGEIEKERKLIEIIRRAKNSGKKVMVYTTQTNKRDLLLKLDLLIRKNGFRTAVMRTSVASGKRREWIRKKLPDIDVLITHPKLVSTGLNLHAFVELVFFDTGYSTYLVRQAARRSLRIDQVADLINVYYFYTDNTIQRDCLSLIAAKNEVSLAVEGEIQEGGLSAMAGGFGSVLSELAKVINGELKTESPLAVFSRLNMKNNEGKTVVVPAPDVHNKPVIMHGVLPALQIGASPHYVPPVFRETNKAGQLALF